MNNYYYYPEERIAVVGMGGLFADANTPDQLWKNVLEKKVSIREVSDEVLNSKIFYDPTVFGKINKNDKSYTKIAAIPAIEKFEELSRKFRIPPAVAEHMDPNQHAAIYCVDQAIESLKNKNLPRERTAVILSTGAPGKNYDNIVRRNFYKSVEDSLHKNKKLNSSLGKDAINEIMEEVAKETLKGTIPVTEDSAPGMLQNIAAARITNLFDFCGPSYTVDAACASALAATVSGIQGLLKREYDALITGGMEITLDENAPIVFSAINALSPTGSFPFDSRANGFVIGLGGGILILKRLEDALRDGDRIFSIISGFGQGSDGKGKYIAAPNEEGQIRVVKNACKMAGYSVDTIEMIEAHGTGTIVGDVVEVSALKKAFTELGVSKKNYCGLGSVKSNIGHLRYSSGAPGLIKTSLALYNKILPPTANIKEVNPKLGLENSPFYILKDNLMWEENKAHPRRANVSAYGFGGADFHIAMEEFRPEFVKKVHSIKIPERENTQKFSEKEFEVVFFSGDTKEELEGSYKEFINKSQNCNFSHSVFASNLNTMVKNCRLSICASSMEELNEGWKIFQRFNDGQADIKSLNMKGVYYGEGKRNNSGEIAFMFPGQASQYPNMLKELKEKYHVANSMYLKADAIWNGMFGGEITPLVFGENIAEDILKDTKNTHPAMFISNMCMYNLFRESGVEPQFMIGHSLGEISALCASGMVDMRNGLNLVGKRGFSFDKIPQKDRGIMMSAATSLEDMEKIIKDTGINVSIANINSPGQIVIAGNENDIEKMSEHLKKEGIRSTVLKVSHGFHTRAMEKGAEDFYKSISNIKYKSNHIKTMACHLVDYYPQNEIKGISEILKDQITQRVNFKDSVLKLYEDGARVFVEVGPSSVLSNLSESILKDKDVKIIASNKKGRNSVEVFKMALGELFSIGIDITMIPALDMLCENDNTKPCPKNQREESFYKSLNNEIHTKEYSTVDSAKNISDSCTCERDVLKDSIVYSGAAFGLPGSYKNVFADDNFQLLLEGRNLIELLTEEESSSLVDLNITRLVKGEEGTTFKKLSTVNEVIRLAGKLGKIDMLSDYKIDEKYLSQMTKTVCAGVAAGYEALKDAKIPLIREKITTSKGISLPGRFVLPEEMRQDTGIIFANGFLAVEPFISEVSRYIASKFGNKTRRDLMDFYEAVISKISDYNAKKILSDWYNMHYSRLLNNVGEEDIYQFNNDFMALISSQANNRLAQFIGAMGPNLHISAACASTTCAVTLAEDLIRGGHAGRMIVIGAENVTSSTVLPWSGGSFLSMGAATDSSDVFEAAVPFDRRRNGMILGAGAVGLVIERECDVAKRGMNGICRILGTHAFNTAGNQVRIDTGRFAIELDRFMSKMEKEHKIKREDMAKNTVYYAHETYSPKGGCSNTEKSALEKTFGESFKDITVINTKGMTGHTMAASIEEAVGAKALQYQKLPPIVNFREEDPELDGLNIYKGGACEFNYILRMVAGYGAQGSYHLIEKIATGDNRIEDTGIYRNWLSKITEAKEANVEVIGRMMVAVPLGENHDKVEKNTQESQTNCCDNTNHTDNSEKALQPKIASNSFPKLDRESNTGLCNETFRGNVVEQVLNIYSEVTRYPVDMLELDMEVESDLGIDTVKQATIFSIICDKFSIINSSHLTISQCPTIGDVVKLVLEQSPLLVCGENSQRVLKEVTQKTISDTSQSNDENINGTGQEKESHILQLISDITKYPVDILDKDMEMEGDLGIDTVKQATIFSMLAEKYNIEQGTKSMSDYKTIGDIIKLVKDHDDRAFGEVAAFGDSTNVDQKTKFMNADLKGYFTNDSVGISVRKLSDKDSCMNNREGTRENVLKIISDITKYPSDMLEDDMELEADLGVDTIKQATIFSALREQFDRDGYKVSDISTYKTIGDIIKLLREDVKMGTEEKPGFSVESDIIGENSEGEEVHEGDSEAQQSQVKRELAYHIPVITEKAICHMNFDVCDKNVFVIGESFETLNNISTKLIRKKANVKTFVLCDNHEKLTMDLKELFKNPVDLIVDICSLKGMEKNDQSQEVNGENSIDSWFLKSRFIFYKNMVSNLNGKGIKILCTVGSGGCFGISQNSSISDMSHLYGAVCGFYKSIRKELDYSEVKILDISKTDKLTKETMSIILKEVSLFDEDYEVGYIGKKRYVTRIEYMDLEDYEKDDLPNNPHFFISGGGNGITSFIVKNLYKEFESKVTIVGRTPVVDNIDYLASLSEEELEEKKKEIKQDLEKEHPKVTPVMVGEKFESIKKSIHVYRLLKEIRDMGGEVSYYSCDVRDYGRLREIYEESVRNYGPVNILVHGAGIEKSKHIMDKSIEEFCEIFTVKAQGLMNLYNIMDKRELKNVVAFSSISGRFGNEAQADYSAANNFVSSFMSLVNKSEKINGLAIEWSGWKDTGIAWRNDYIRNHSEENGIHLIEPSKGVDAFIKLLKRNNKGSSSVIVSKGIDFIAKGRNLNPRHEEVSLIDWVVKEKGEVTNAHKILSVKKDPIMDHHRLGKTPIMPAVGFMEMYAQYHSLHYKPSLQYCFRNVKLWNPLKLYNENPQEVIIVPEAKDNGFKIKAYTYFESKVGISKLIHLNEMEVDTKLGDYQSLYEILDLEEENMEVGSSKEALDDYYNKFNNSIRLGSLFIDQNRENNIYRRNKKGAIYDVVFPSEQLQNKKYRLESLLVNPAFMDNVFQACGVHTLLENAKVYLPWRIEELGVLKAPKEEGTYRVYAKMKDENEEQKIYDVILFNQNKEICYYAKNVIMKKLG